MHAAPSSSRPPSAHPEAVKVRRWRARKAAERRGAMLVALLVEPAEVAALRRLGLVGGDPQRWDQPRPEPDEVEAALRRLLGAARPLAGLIAALAAEATDHA